MISFKEFQQWVTKEAKRTNPNPNQFVFERGDIVAFIYAPPKGTKAKANDMFVIMSAVEMRSHGQGEGVWGCNLYDIPGKLNRDNMGNILKSDEDNMIMVHQMYRNSVTRNAFKLYLKDNIKSPVMKLTAEQLNKVL